MTRPGILLWVALARAGDPSALGGTWEVDLDASEKVSPLLEIRGTPWALRAVADTLSHSLTFTVEPDRVTSGVRSLMMTQEEVWLTDGVYRPVGSKLGDTIQVAHSWSPEGDLVTVMKATLKDGRPGVLTTSRHVSADGATLQMRYTLVEEDGDTSTCLRVYRRK